jgi:hypothetical protein
LNAKIVLGCNWPAGSLNQSSTSSGSQAKQGCLIRARLVYQWTCLTPPARSCPRAIARCLVRCPLPGLSPTSKNAATTIAAFKNGTRTKGGPKKAQGRRIPGIVLLTHLIIKYLLFMFMNLSLRLRSLVMCLLRTPRRISSCRMWGSRMPGLDPVSITLRQNWK